MLVIVLWAASIWMNGMLWGFTAAAPLRPVQRVASDEDRAVAEAEAVLRQPRSHDAKR